MKRNKKLARKMRSGTSPYVRYSKRPYGYAGQVRLASGELKTKANDSLRNKYM